LEFSFPISVPAGFYGNAPFYSDYRIFFFKPGEKASLWYSLNRARRIDLGRGFEGFEILRIPWGWLVRNSGVVEE